MRHDLVLLVAVALASSTAFAGTVYKCPGADRKIEYRDVPCTQGKKLDTDFNSIDTAPNPEVERKAREFDARIEKRAKERRATRAAIAADNEAFYRECQGYLDDAARQRPWLDSYSETARHSARVEIGIAHRKYDAAGCR